jgi:hypothetical protein
VLAWEAGRIHGQRTFAEVVLVSIGAQDTRHGGDVETEQTSADGGKGADGVDTVESLRAISRGTDIEKRG